MEFGDHVVLILAQLGGAHAAPDRVRGCRIPAPVPLWIVFHDRAQAVILHEPIAMAGIDQPIDDMIMIELAAGDQLEQREGRERLS